MEVDTDDFGKMFANMASDEQVEVLRAMIDHMKPHQIQWDYIGIDLELEENIDLKRELKYVFSSLLGE
jgi:hypothetical protein